MQNHAEERFLPYTPEQMFDLVADIERYPEFLPWCVAARITHRENEVLTADMMVGFTAIREKFTSKVTLVRPERIDVEYIKGPFKYLKNSWIFIAKDHGCVIEFDIAFEVRSRLLRRIFEPGPRWPISSSGSRPIGAPETPKRQPHQIERRFSGLSSFQRVGKSSNQLPAVARPGRTMHTGQSRGLGGGEFFEDLRCVLGM